MNNENLDLNLLRVFDAVMTEKNLTRAADRLAMTQPAVSNSLKRLRAALNDDLLIRTSHGVRATPYATRIWPRIRGALDSLQSAISPAAFDPATVKVTFRVAMPDSIAALLLPPLVRLVEQVAPGMQLQILSLTTREPRPMLHAGEADMAIGSFPGVVAGPAIASDSNSAGVEIDHARLYSGKYVCVMRRDHPLAGGELTLDDYCAANHLQLSVAGRARGMVDERLAKLGRRRTTVLTVNQYFTTGRVIANSDLLTILPLHLLTATGMQDALAWKELPFSMPEMNVDLVWQKQETRNPVHRWLREQIVHFVEDNTDRDTHMLLSRVDPSEALH
jgi:DNA-binding transcriptional LysR family regulator